MYQVNLDRFHMLCLAFWTSYPPFYHYGVIFQIMIDYYLLGEMPDPEALRRRPETFAFGRLYLYKQKHYDEHLL